MDIPRSMTRCTLAALALGALAGCATTDPGVTAASAPIAATAPEYRVGDRWVYRIREGWANPIVYEETWTVTSMSGGTTSVRVSAKGPGLDVERTELWPAPGRVSQGALFDVETRRFETPLDRYRFPLAAGTSWNQFVRQFNEQRGQSGPINRSVRVTGFDRVTTPAGTFDAVRLRVFMRLDDDDFWRWPTDTNYEVWYAPAVKASVRETRRADYLEKGGGVGPSRLPTQNSLVELVSFTPGA
jgi:hypothetical protein